MSVGLIFSVYQQNTENELILSSFTKILILNWPNASEIVLLVFIKHISGKLHFLPIKKNLNSFTGLSSIAIDATKRNSKPLFHRHVEKKLISIQIVNTFVISYAVWLSIKIVELFVLCTSQNKLGEKKTKIIE